MKEKGDDKSGYKDNRNEGNSIIDPTEIRKIKEHYEPFII